VSSTVADTEVPVGGDVMLAIDDAELLTNEDLGSHLALQTRPDDTISVRIIRDGEERTVDLTLGTRPDELE
ncbi:MAG: PDZ domain-containing protein, partial [Halohasta sp.]